MARSASETGSVMLREVRDDDLPVFFGHLQDEAALQMAAFTPENPADHDAFDAHWARIRADDGKVKRTIVLDGAVAGHIVSFTRGEEPEITYWIGREHWGRGVATRAVREFLALVPERPLFARAAQDNAGSIRVLEKCGFTITGHDRFFANARGEEIDEVIMTLKGD